MSSKFDPEYYSLYRPHYPSSTFAGISEHFSRHSEPLTVVDLGCGTGHSTRSFLDLSLSARVIGIDSDPFMIETAKRTTVAPVEWIVGHGERTPLGEESVDLILIGSAFHWMDRAQAIVEFVRIMRPNGLIRIFEYQFPKAILNPNLNEWIRREFNLNWKAPNQKPRGTLRELTQILSSNRDLLFHSESKPLMRTELTAEQLLGHILSQSRVLHYMNSFSRDEKHEFSARLEKKIKETIRPKEVFDFKLSWIQFVKRCSIAAD